MSQETSKTLHDWVRTSHPLESIVVLASFLAQKEHFSHVKKLLAEGRRLEAGDYISELLNCEIKWSSHGWRYRLGAVWN